MESFVFAFTIATLICFGVFVWSESIDLSTKYPEDLLIPRWLCSEVTMNVIHRTQLERSRAHIVKDLNRGGFMVYVAGEDRNGIEFRADAFIGQLREIADPDSVAMSYITDRLISQKRALEDRSINLTP